MQTVTELQAQFDEALKAREEADRRVTLFAARIGQVEVLKLADDHPGLVSFGFETESEYNDEGGYYDVARFFGVEVKEPASGAEVVSSEEDEIEQALMDLGLEPQAWAILCGSAGEHQGETTIADLRERVL